MCATTADTWVARSAELALACVEKEYPNKIAHVLSGDADVKPPPALQTAVDLAVKLALEAVARAGG